jgi:hypothetical protein
MSADLVAERSVEECPGRNYLNPETETEARQASPAMLNLGRDSAKRRALRKQSLTGEPSDNDMLPVPHIFRANHPRMVDSEENLFCQSVLIFL